MKLTIGDVVMRLIKENQDDEVEVIIANKKGIVLTNLAPMVLGAVIRVMLKFRRPG